MTDILKRLRDPKLTVHGRAGLASEAADEIERLRMDAEEHDRLWAASGERDRQMFAELRRDLDLPPSRVDAEMDIP